MNVLIVGDIFHSRVARSNIWGLTKMGSKVVVCGPATLIPPNIEAMGAQVSNRLEQCIPDADVIMVLRLQKERQQQMLLPSLREYSTCYGINGERLKKAKKDVLIMHPGPDKQGGGNQPRSRRRPLFGYPGPGNQRCCRQDGAAVSARAKIVWSGKRGLDKEA